MVRSTEGFVPVVSIWVISPSSPRVTNTLRPSSVAAVNRTEAPAAGCPATGPLRSGVSGTEVVGPE